MALVYVAIPCPSRKHVRSIVTFRDHAVAAMFCLPCGAAWTESTANPVLRDVPISVIDHDGRPGVTRGPFGDAAIGPSG